MNDRPPMNGHLVVMARRPVLGQVKTRLAAEIGPLAAWRIYRDMTGGILKRLAGPAPWRCWLAMTPDSGAPVPWCRGWTVIGQGTGDLGRRMLRPGRILPPGPVVVVGSDIPALDRPHVAAAFSALARHDLVFGPAEDGGFWLVGFAARARGVNPFAGVAWSRPDTLDQCLARIPAGRGATTVDELFDLDEAADLEKLAENCRNSRVLFKKQRFPQNRP